MKTKNKNNRGGIISRNSYSFMSAIIAAVIMLFVYAVWQFFPFGDNIILRMDLYHQYAPLFAELYERIFGGHTLLYSFTSGLGSSFLGNYFNYLSSPSMLFVLIFGHYNVPEAVAAMVLIKASASAYTCSYFLGKYSGKKDVSTAAFGILYAFCGYFIAYYWNVMWLDAMVAFPLVILGIYYIIKKGKALPYVLSLTYVMLTNYYMAYMVCLLSIIFFLYLYFSENSLSQKLNEDIILKDKYKKTLTTRFVNSKFMMRGVTFAGASVLAACIAAAALLPVFFILQRSSATSSTFPTSFSSYFSIFDFLANHLAGAEPTIRSSGDTVYPNVYCGILTLVLVPLFLFSKKISLREKIAASAVSAFFFFSFNINMLNFVWHGFHFPNDLPYRFSFAYSFFLLFLAYKVFKVIEHISSKEILCSSLAVALFAVFVEKITSANVDLTVVWTSVIFAAVYAVILVFVKNPKYMKSSMAVLLITAVCAEVLVADTGNYKVTQTKDAYNGSYNDTKTVIDYIDEQEDDNGFYRMELATLLTRMDNCWFFYDGVSTFTSMAYEDVARLQDNLGLYGNKINSYTYNCQTGLYNSMMSLKYIVDNHSYVATDSFVPNMEGNFLYSKLYEYNEMTVYENNYWLPVGFSVNDGIETAWQYDNTNPFTVQNDFFYNASGVADILEPIAGTVNLNSNIDSVSDTQVSGGVFNVYKTDSSASSNEISYTYHVESAQNVYIYFNSNDVESLLISTGSFTYNQDINNHGYVVDLGNVAAGTDINISYSLKSDSASTQVQQYVYGMNSEKFISAYNSIVNGGILNITENTERRLSGTINLAVGKMLYTSIPYDEGWSVYVDGEKVASENIVKVGDALMGVKLAAGEHTVEFRFTPKGLTAGCVISGAGILLLAILLFLKKKKKLFFSPAYRQDVLELGRWRDLGLESELKEQAVQEEEAFERLLEEAEEDGLIPPEDENAWQTALDNALAYGMAQSAVAEDAEEPQEAAEEYIPDDDDFFEDIPSDAELDEFEKATDNLEKPKAPKAETEDNKNSKKKRIRVAVLTVLGVCAVVGAVAVMIYAVGGSDEPTTEAPVVTSAPIVTVGGGDESREQTTETTTAAATTAPTTVATTAPTTVATTAPTTAAPTTAAPTTARPTEAYTGAYETYVVAAGDNFYSILRSFGVQDTPANVQKMCDFNGISVNGGLSVGQEIRVPTE